MIEQPANLSAGQRIASLRQFFRSRRDSSVQRGADGDFESTMWPETEWSDTRFDAPLLENA